MNQEWGVEGGGWEEADKDSKANCPAGTNLRKSDEMNLVLEGLEPVSGEEGKQVGKG